MAPSEKALVTPTVLVWAREESGFSPDEVAKKLQVDVTKLTAWEQGEDQPTISQLRKLANIYKRSIGIFFLPAAPPRTPKMHDFRRISSDDAHSETPQLRLEIRRAYSRRETAIELLAELGEPAPIINKEISLSDDPEAVGRGIRSWLKLSYAEQTSWKDPWKAFKWWRSAIETHGILVFQISGVRVEEMRGFSIHDKPFPIIGVNINDHPRGRIFSMLHELTHILLHEGGICTLRESRSSNSQEQRVERYCNAVAGATIVPLDYISVENAVAMHSSDHIWTDTELRSIASRYQSSRETLLRRLLIIGKTTEEYYQQKRKEFVKEYESLAEDKEERNIIVPPFQRAINQVGESYSRLLLTGYNQGLVNATTLSDALGMKLKHVNKLEQAIFGQAMQ